MRIVRERPGITVAQLCRLLNKKDLDYCITIRCCDYLNPRRRRGGCQTPPCRYRYSRVSRLVRRLEREGKLYSYRERKPDNRQPRGWDYMKALYRHPKKPISLKRWLEVNP